MSREEREWNPRFIKYMEMIAAHPNYKGLRIDRKKDGSLRWIATAKSEIGKERIRWCLAYATRLGIPNQPGVYADVMLEIHPTKQKVCQTCGREMSLFYHYPNAHFLNSLNNRFNTDFTECDHISDIWDDLIEHGVNKNDISLFLIQKGDLDLDYTTATKEEIINALENACRKGSKKCLGPGAMSNFPDRADGFHTYNRCCRSSQDKGRSKENLKSYTKDRRAYEYWSDGNIHAANQFMGSHFFDGISADHIGPISLGFIHDPRYLQPMASSDNSSKRDRLQLVDIEKIIETESRTKVYPISWYSSNIWEHIKSNYKNNPSKIAGPYRDALKQNLANYMFVLWFILVNCSEHGEEFLIKSFLQPHFNCFQYTYKFNKLGEIIKETPRHQTDRSKNEIERYIRIAMESVYDYNNKNNRNMDPDLITSERETLSHICEDINNGSPISASKERVQQLMLCIQQRIILTL